MRVSGVVLDARPKFEEAVYVLHCFQKKTQVTTKQDKDIAAERYRAVVNARKVKR